MRYSGTLGKGKGRCKPRRDAQLELPLARQVVATMLRLPEFPPHVALIVVDCRNFHGTFNGHVGLHYDVQREYLEDRRGVNKFVDNLIDQGVDPVMLGDRSEKHTVAFYCRAGEHVRVLCRHGGLRCGCEACVQGVVEPSQLRTVQAMHFRPAH